MSQLLFVGFPDGSLRIGKVVSILKKEGRITYFVEGDSFFSHEEMDASAQRFAITSLISLKFQRQKGSQLLATQEVDCLFCLPNVAM